jgi:prepilin-type N-terminal cleavage/methylation domain-containing protein
MPARPSTSSSVFISNPAELTTENTESSEVKPLAALDAYHILSILRHPIKHFRASLKFHPPAEQAKFPFNPPSSVSSVSFDSLAPARLALRANLRLLHLAFPKRSIVVKSSPVCPSPAFTLIELLVTVTVIAILAGITLAAMGGVNQKATRDKTKAEIAAISNALEQYKSVNDSYPAAGGNGTVPFASSGNATIQPFFIASKISTNAAGQLLDSYGNAYQYSTNRTGMKNPASFDVWSNGRSTSDTSDDIGNW